MNVANPVFPLASVTVTKPVVAPFGTVKTAWNVPVPSLVVEATFKPPKVITIREFGAKFVPLTVTVVPTGPLCGRMPAEGFGAVCIQTKCAVSSIAAFMVMIAGLLVPA
jgi:hypothetical protein